MDKEHATPEKPSYRLIGQPPMTGEERAAFLQQARAAEAKYDNEVRAADPFGNNRSELRRQAVHVAESSSELSFSTKHWGVLIDDIHAKTRALENNLELLNSDLPSKTPGSTYADDREWLQDQMREMHASVKDSLKQLERHHQISVDDQEWLQGEMQKTQASLEGSTGFLQRQPKEERLSYTGTRIDSIKLEGERLFEAIKQSHMKLEQFEAEWQKSEWYKPGTKVDADVAQKADVDASNKDVNLAQQADVNAPKTAWHKQWVDPSQPLQFTEGLRRTAESGRDREPGKPLAEFKPNIAPDNPRALYTSSGETEIKQVWHQDPKNFPYDNPVSGEALKRASKLGLAAMGLLAASEAANATPGSLVDKLAAAGHALKDIAIDAVPGVTYVKKMQAGQYEEARLDAASYLPFGDVTEMANSPEVQAVIDALPKNQPALKSMMGNQAEPPINRHLAEYQLLVMQAKNAGNLTNYLTFSSDLNNLAEKKLKLQPEWAHNAEIFSAAIQAPETNWKQLASNYPDMAPQIAIHLASVRSGHSATFVSQMDAQLTDSLAKGIAPILHPVAAEASQNSTHAEASLAQ